MNENIETAHVAALQSSQIESLAQQFIDALHQLEQSENRQDSQDSDISMLFSEDAVLANAATELSGKKIEGRDAIHRFWVEYKSTLGKVRSEFHHVTTSQNSAGLFWTTASDDGSTHYHGATLLQFDETGMIAFFRGYYDTRELAN